MSMRAAVVGSGPNGLVAACVLAQAGWEVVVYEAAEAAGGALRSAEIFGSGLISDLGASVHPLNLASPAYQQLLAEVGDPNPAAGVDEAPGLHWKHPQIPAAHGYDDGPPVLLHRSLEETAAGLGADGRRWKALLQPVAENWEAVRRAAFTPPSRPYSLRGIAAERGVGIGAGAEWGTGTGMDAEAQAESLLARTSALLQLGARGGLPAAVTSRFFSTGRAQALFAGLAAHSTAPLSRPMTSVFGVVLGAAAHASGWPVMEGGSQRIVDALLKVLQEHGGTVQTGFRVEGLHGTSTSQRGRHKAQRQGWLISGTRVAEGKRDRHRTAEEPADVVVLDLSPQQVLALEGLRLPGAVQRAMHRWDYGPGIVKVDYLVDGPIPWAAPELAEAGTVHLGGSAGQIAASEAAVARGVLPSRPYVLVTQPAAADSTRTPDHRTVAWAYAHVPYGLDAAGTERAVRLMEAEIARQAPDFQQAILQRKVWGPADLQSWNRNLVGGTISGGMPTVLQTFSRPARPLKPYTTGVDGVYLGSASTPPGGGAHGMAGWNAAHTVLRDFS
ncbi:NAD(P)/FAD-dependent oxidoreductase [Nesterenkonia massiliensis]|uniref:Pyridine nucleotide-disulfide oxidoreductase domain-containing protein 2 n=1 Tax=Nesterenkonia massiliensis TaxID=1232429 RepID=A0ABT2HPA0_9MICC|nr:NAD(P)/FAD-dependent oxidoreductase [Nesterenkonia massiliensis]MCT1606517.1 NAD(P)/FAD-dependent oxidoreductase [Nesterenkonia massiliensis]